MLVVNLVAGDPLSGEHLHGFLTHFHMRQDLVLPDPHLYAKNSLWLCVKNLVHMAIPRVAYQIGYSEHCKIPIVSPTAWIGLPYQRKSLQKLPEGHADWFRISCHAIVGLIDDAISIL